MNADKLANYLVSTEETSLGFTDCRVAAAALLFAARNGCEFLREVITLQGEHRAGDAL